MADPGFKAVDADGNKVSLATAVLIAEKLAELFGAAVAAPAANTIGARLVSILAGIGSPTDGVWDGTPDTDPVSLASAMKTIAKAMLDPSAASITFGTLDAAATAAVITAIRDRIATIGTRAYGTVDTLSTNGAAATTGKQMTLPAGEVMFEAIGAPLFYKIGGSGAVAASLTDSKHLAVNEKFHERVASGQYVSIIRDGATDAKLLIVPVA